MVSRAPSLNSQDDKKTGHDEVLRSTSSNIHEIPDVEPQLSRKIVRKYDLLLLPLLAAMYLCNSLDKTNLANAKTDHFDRDIRLKGNQYYQLITAFYAPFCVFGVPITILIKKFNAARVLPIMALSFGALCMCSAAVHNFAQIITIRMLLAVSESACLPGVVYYLTTFYTRGEIASRLGVFYAASSIAGAFGGLIAYAVFQIKSSPLRGWQILFLAEGSLTVVVGILLALFLPRSPSSAKFLSIEEKEAATNRLLKDASDELDSKLDLRRAFRELGTWHTLIWIAMEFCIGVPLASVSNFLPQIVGRLGYSTVRTNLLTVAPNIVGALCLIGFTQSSDRFRERSFHLLAPVGLTLTGFIVLCALDPLKSKAASYFCCFLLCAGSFTPSVLICSWAANNTPDESQRAVLVALVVAFGNAAGLISSNIFRAQDEPKYVLALAVTAAFGGAAMVFIAGFGTWMRWDNRRRDMAQGIKLHARDVDTRLLKDGPANQSFRWMC